MEYEGAHRSVLEKTFRKTWIMLKLLSKTFFIKVVDIIFGKSGAFSGTFTAAFSRNTYLGPWQTFLRRHLGKIINLLKFKNRNVETSCEICSKLTKKTPERRQ